MSQPGARTRLTELMTGLGTLGDADFRERLPTLPPEFIGVGLDDWAAVTEAWDTPEFEALADSAFANGKYFLDATEALRRRRPLHVEWAGPRRPPGDEVAPVDLRIDHVFLISCKYLSKITMNASPAYLFDRLLTGRQGRRSGDWFQSVACAEHTALWHDTRTHLLDCAEPSLLHIHDNLHDNPAEMDAPTHRIVSRLLRGRTWPPHLQTRYDALCERASAASAQRWNDAIAAAGPSAAEAMLWRLLRIGNAPYFVLGAHAEASPVRLRVASPWDWRREFEFHSLTVSPATAGQPTVEWRAQLTERHNGAPREVHGHIEVRWSHGRFSGPPEAKVYLDTPFDQVPGYWALS